MTIKRKANAYASEYEEALDRAKKLLDSPRTCFDIDQLKDIFPQLRESEDERIIKTLQEYVKSRNWNLNGPTQAEVLAWLEKQKEKKEIPLMNGDADLYFDEWNQQKQNPTKRQCFEEGMRYAQRLQKEQKPAEWSDEDKEIMRSLIRGIRRHAFFGGISTDKIVGFLKSIYFQHNGY